MPARPLPVAVALLLASLLCLILPARALADVGYRPTSGQGAFAYQSPEAPPLISPQVVVHYEAAGPDAPDATDANQNGVPDYVERVSAAAARALAFYASQGFLLPLPDSGGPNGLPDIYIKHLPPGYYGESLPAQDAEPGGGFVVISNTLSTSLVDPEGGIETTVAHELFHMIQFSYFPSLPIPSATDWADEGTAVAMSILVYPEIEDVANQKHLDEWLKESWLPLYYVDGQDGCAVHCYGGAWWWLWLFKLDPKLLPDYYGRLYGYELSGRSVGLGIQPLSEVLSKDGYGSLDQVFTDFSTDLYRRQLAVPTYATSVSFRPLKAAVPDFLREVRTQPTMALIAGLSAQYITLRLPAGAHGLKLLLSSAQGPAPKATVVLGGQQGRALSGSEVSRHGQSVLTRILVHFKGSEHKVVLILASGRPDPTAYQLALQALR
jgi:hypothetical protein